MCIWLFKSIEVVAEYDKRGLMKGNADEAVKAGAHAVFSTWARTYAGTRCT